MKGLFSKRPKLSTLQESGILDVNGTPLPYIIERSARRTRTLAFAMTAQATLRVIVPLRMRGATISSVLKEHTNGLIHNLLRQHHRTAPDNLAQFTAHSFLVYMGHRCRLHITQDTEQPPQCHLGLRRININIPHAGVDDETLRQEARTEFTLWIKKRARRILKKRMDVWAARMGVTYKQMIVTSPEQRWGSCSVENIIRLNWRLMLAPLPLIDYVVAHELAHCVHKDHSPRFWRFLATAMPDCQARRRQLRTISSQLNF